MRKRGPASHADNGTTDLKAEMDLTKDKVCGVVNGVANGYTVHDVVQVSSY